MVTTFPVHEPDTPVGKPVTDAPVAPVVANVMFVIALFIHTVWLVPAATVFNGVTVTVQVPVDTVAVVLHKPSLAYLRYEVVVVKPAGGV